MITNFTVFLKKKAEKKSFNIFLKTHFWSPSARKLHMTTFAKIILNLLWLNELISVLVNLIIYSIIVWLRLFIFESTDSVFLFHPPRRWSRHLLALPKNIDIFLKIHCFFQTTHKKSRDFPKKFNKNQYSVRFWLICSSKK